VHLFVEHGLQDELVVRDFLGLEPHADLVLGTVRSIRSVDDVASDGDAQVTTDGASLGVVGVGGTDQLASLQDNVLSFPDHGDNRSAAEVLAETVVERLGAQVSVVLLGHLQTGVDHLHANQLVASGLESANDFTNKSTLDTIGLDGNESALGLSSGVSVVGLVASVERGGVP